jgi:hypothetical protein
MARQTANSESHILHPMTHPGLLMALMVAATPKQISEPMTTLFDALNPNQNVRVTY